MMAGMAARAALKKKATSLRKGTSRAVRVTGVGCQVVGAGGAGMVMGLSGSRGASCRTGPVFSVSLPG